ncbi:hypothetical protein [Rhizobium sp. A37_96]
MRMSAMGRLADGDGCETIRMPDALTPWPAGVTTMHGIAAIGL